MYKDKKQEKLNTLEKALEINLDPSRYGTFAEIGAGQETVRWFFQAGASAGTIAKSMSAYDMVVSDSIYGKSNRYVSLERLQAMLEYEYSLNVDRLKGCRGDTTAFFAFANTVSARNFHGTNRCHGWVGVRFQSHPRDEFSEIILHVRMLDKTNAAQQEALGIVGVNLLYAAFNYFHQPEKLLESLLDNLSIDRIEVDMIKFSGIEFRHVDNRIMSLRLVQLGLSSAAMFGPDKKMLMPSDVFYKKAVLVERGSFRPVCNVNIDILEGGKRAFCKEFDLDPGDVQSVMEITMNNLMQEGSVDLHDFLARADLLCELGFVVMISEYFEYYRLAQYLRSSTRKPIGLTMGIPSLLQLLNENYYKDLDGGILEALGRIFKHEVKLYVYPAVNRETGEIITVETLRVEDNLTHLYQHIRERSLVHGIEDYDPKTLGIYSRELLKKIRNGEDGWDCMVPSKVANLIRKKNFFK